MADNVAITAGTGTIIAADEVVDATLGTVKAQYIKIMDGTLDGTAKTTVKAASTAAVATDPALVVAISPNGQNANLAVNANSGVTGNYGAPVAALDYYSAYKPVAASQTNVVLGASGAQYDYLAGLLVVPATTSPGAVSIADGNGSAITMFTGGSTSVSDLRPFMIPLGIYAIASTTPGWKVTTGTNVSVVAVGKFT
jgi:hypothetical protein